MILFYLSFLYNTAGFYFSHKTTIAVNIIVAHKVAEKLEALYSCTWPAIYDMDNMICSVP